LSSVILDSFDVYKENIKLILIFSIPFLIAFAIPLFAPLPTYMSAGAIFLRSASIFVNGNINFLSLSVITLSTIFSLLFLSFAFVLISLIVKAKRTRSKIGRRAFLNIESYIGKVFAIFLAYTILLLLVNVLGYSIGMSAQLTAIIGFAVFTLLFYAPSATVVDDKKIVRAIKDSVALILHEPQYFVIWLILLTIVISVIDAICIYLFITPTSSYVVLVLNSLIVLPYFIIFQAEAYMSRFRLLRH
jgi:hypothetical protein